MPGVLDSVRMPECREDVRLLLEPPPGEWPGLVRAAPGDAVSRGTRGSLGLGADRPVVMAGHQPGFWHPGILAKWYATEALAGRLGAVGAWAVVDQSPGAGAGVEYPALRGGRLVRGRIALGDADSSPSSQGPAVLKAPGDAALPGVGAGLTRMAGLLGRYAGEPSLARQLQRACEDALGERRSLRTFLAGDLHATPAFGELVGAMRAEPGACARLYNEAAAARPEAGVRQLAVTPGAVELPLWERSEAPGPWRTVMSDRLADLPDGRLVLRGLPMTGLLRRWACDLFVHGTGGGSSRSEAGYDRVTERWLDAWLGMRELAPAVVASATLRLWFGDLARGVPSPEEIAGARALAHRAAHDPALLGDAARGGQKRELAARVAALPRGGEERSRLFARMVALREESAAEHAGALEALRARAEQLAGAVAESGIVAERTWPWVFYPASRLGELRGAVGRALGAGG